MDRVATYLYSYLSLLIPCSRLFVYELNGMIKTTNANDGDLQLMED